MKKLALIISLVLLLLSSACSIRQDHLAVPEKDLQSNEITIDAFDTTGTITIYGVTNSKDADDYFYSMETLIMAYNDCFSKTDPASEIYEINHRTTDSVLVHAETATLFGLAKDLYDWSNGKFDISAGTLIDLWDVKNRKTLPTESEIKEAMEHTHNFDYKIEKVDNPSDGKTHKITFHGDKLTKYDLGGLIKGYCSDELKRMLSTNDAISACIINLGGNVLVTGNLSGRIDGAFNIGIYKPFTKGEIVDKIAVKNKHVITSGNYQRYFKIDGDDRVYHHIIDPTTGYPTNNGLDSVTIISDNGLLGDYLSTACMLLGEEDSKKLIDFASEKFNDKNIQSIFVRSDGTMSKYPANVVLK